MYSYCTYVASYSANYTKTHAQQYKDDVFQ